MSTERKVDLGVLTQWALPIGIILLWQALSALGLYVDRRPKLKTIKVPTVVVHGADDPLMSVEGGKDTAANIPSAELRIIPGMGHDLPIPLANTVADAIAAAATRARTAK